MAGDFITQAGAGVGAIGALLLAASKMWKTLRPEVKPPAPDLEEWFERFKTWDREADHFEMRGLEQRMDSMNGHLEALDRAMLRLELSVQNLQERRRT